MKTLYMMLLLVSFASAQRWTAERAASGKFWTPATIALVALDGSAKAADGYATYKNMISLGPGGREHDPLSRPFVKTTPRLVVSSSIVFAGEIGAAHWLHRRGHERLSHAVLATGAASNSYGAYGSFHDYYKAGY